MAWAKNNYTSSSVFDWNDANAIGNSIRTWEGGVNASGNNLSNVVIVQDSFQTITPQNGWVNFGSPAPDFKARVDKQNNLVILGIIKSGTMTAGTIIGTLPAGMRPAFPVHYVVATNGGPVEISIDASTGVMKLYTAAPANIVLDLNHTVSLG
jgi:hypothetical protein